MPNNEPRTFHSRRPLKITLISVACFFAVAIVFAVALFFGLQKNIAYTDDGELYLDIPWLEEYMGHENLNTGGGQTPEQSGTN